MAFLRLIRELSKSMSPPYPWGNHDRDAGASGSSFFASHLSGPIDTRTMISPSKTVSSIYRDIRPPGSKTTIIGCIIKQIR